MIDNLTTIGNSLIQHGPYNDRIYLLKLSQDDFPEIITKLDSLASQENYSKIFAKLPDYAKDDFLAKEYVIEASIPNFYHGRQTAYFMAKYFSNSRKQLSDPDELNNVLRAAKFKYSDESPFIILSEGFNSRECHLSDISEIAQLYQKVFETYPFPIHDPDYIAETMADNVTYFGVWHNQSLVSLASSEMDLNGSNVEMTDFATLPDYRGHNLSAYLLQTMEHHMEKLNVKTAYTIARALSYGMNITFAKMGYLYSGTLINNTNISGSLESMNVWYKPL
ncbi:MAG: hypothetical protein APF84_04680 [Gracilibacter sp. BRH_c7a]|nr:MAG: hypothetical protein APF84_04680 [Gracilibacter sp. BRH_c7a]